MEWERQQPARERWFEFEAEPPELVDGEQNVAESALLMAVAFLDLSQRLELVLCHIKTAIEGESLHSQLIRAVWATNSDLINGQFEQQGMNYYAKMKIGGMAVAASNERRFYDLIRDGDTWLHIALRNSSSPGDAFAAAARTLIIHGASVDIINKEGETAMDLDRSKCESWGCTVGPVEAALQEVIPIAQARAWKERQTERREAAKRAKTEKIQRVVTGLAGILLHEDISTLGPKLDGSPPQFGGLPALCVSHMLCI